MARSPYSDGLLARLWLTATACRVTAALLAAADAAYDPWSRAGSGPDGADRRGIDHNLRWHFARWLAVVAGALAVRFAVLRCASRTGRRNGGRAGAGKATFSWAWPVGEVVKSPGPACEEFVAARHAPMIRAAFLLTGSQADAEDLVQDALVRVVSRWRSVAAADDPVAYANQILVNVFLSGRERRWRGEVPHGVLPDRTEDAEFGRVDDRDRLRRALGSLPARQRAAVVLRHYEQQSEAQTAALLGCSVGTVKSLSSRGLAALRAATGRGELAREEAP